jgi:hypothetical protein
VRIITKIPAVHLSSCLWLLCTLLINSLPSGSTGPAVNTVLDSPVTAPVGFRHELPFSTRAPAKDSVPFHGSVVLANPIDQFDGYAEGEVDDGFDPDIGLVLPPVLLPQFSQSPLSLLSLGLRVITFTPITPPPKL